MGMFDKKTVQKELVLIAKIVKRADEEWSKSEWEAYKKEHPATELHPTIKKEGPAPKQEDLAIKPKTDNSAPQGNPVMEHYKNLHTQILNELDKVRLPKSPEEGQNSKPQTKNDVDDSKPSTKYTVKPLFKDTGNLPDIAHQPAKTKEAVYSEAKVAEKTMLNILDNGGDLEKALGMKHFPPGSINLEDSEGLKKLDVKGPVLMTAPLKGEKRATEKVNADYGGDWSRLTDVVRASIAVDDYSDLDKVVEQLNKSGIKLAKKPKDRFSKPTDVGYRDVLMNVEFPPNGHVGELQLHVKSMLKAKAVAHKQYEDMRTIEGKMKQEKRTEMTPEETESHEKAKKESLQIYNKAWDEANAGAEGQA